MTSIKQTSQTRPILVTGAHRTGTTWVGKMLAAGGQTAYISEPLNVWHRPGVMCAPVRRWYTYICEDNEAQYLEAFRETLSLRYHLGAELGSLRSRKDFLRMGRDWWIFTRGRLLGQRPLLKDPFAVFSSLWFARRLDCQVVVTVRHPAAFASSLKRLGWDFDLNDLLDQPLLMRDWLEPFREELKTIAKTDDVIAQASLLWRMIYQVVDQFRMTEPGLSVVRHEDLSLEPLDGYARLYAELGLDFSAKARQGILQASSAENPKELSKQSVHKVKLDSKANLVNWKHRLTDEEFERIKVMTADVFEKYYPDAD
jgi:hypothetical protein